ncbi:NADH:ubiquinone oxidoreductase [Candidatus Woesearchaeota archaeon]|jgi:sulfhydrogenase subunit delta|nr:NADH:ubiquinone oxidoreductase [Candidatus Woesearchaeota archaeon]
MTNKKPVIGFFTFTCCEGCGFTVLFLDELSQLMEKLDIGYFNLIKEKNKEANFDIAFVEGAITSKREIKILNKIRAKSKFLVALGACACHGGIPAMRNFIENKDLGKYIYNQQMLSDSIEAQPISNFVKVDYYMYGCPILKTEFMEFINGYLEGKIIKEFEGPVCGQCPRRGKNCFLQEKTMCLGAVTHGGCDAICLQQGIPCIMCRGPLKTANFPAEIALFKSWGVDEKEIMSKLTRFGEQQLEKKVEKDDKTI